MLVLSRKAGQELIIGDNIRITINKISGNRITLGVEAPDDVRIIRGELEPIVKSFEEPVAKQPVTNSCAQPHFAVVEQQAAEVCEPMS